MLSTRSLNSKNRLADSPVSTGAHISPIVAISLHFIIFAILLQIYDNSCNNKNHFGKLSRAAGGGIAGPIQSLLKISLVYTFPLTSSRHESYLFAIIALERRLNSSRSLTTLLPKNVLPSARVGS